MRTRYTFEILAMALLLASGSLLRPARSTSGCNPAPAAQTAHAHVLHQNGSRG